MDAIPSLVPIVLTNTMENNLIELFYKDSSYILFKYLDNFTSFEKFE